MTAHQRILHVLRTYGPDTSAGLAATLRMPLRTVSAHLSAMEARGLVETTGCIVRRDDSGNRSVGQPLLLIRSACA